MAYEVEQDNGEWITKEIDYKDIQTVIRLGSHNYSGYCSDRIIEVVNYDNKLYTKLFDDETWCSCTLGGMCGTCESNLVQEHKLHKFDLELIKSMIKNSYKEELASRAKDQCCSFWIDRFQRQWGYEQNHTQFKEIEKIKTITVSLRCTNKESFNIEVVNGEAWYRPEERKLSKEWIKFIIDSYNNTGFIGSPYSLSIEKITVGCMEGTYKEDWEKVYNLLK